MCLPCQSKKMRIWSFMENRMTGYPIKFDQNQIDQLDKKFKRISGNKPIINKALFQQNMGILGLSSVEGFSDRLFNSFDTDNDGQISFQDFVQYMEVLKSGTEKNKAKISFRLIDLKNKNKVSMKEFKQFLDDYFRSWTSITNSIVTPEMKQRTDDYVQKLYSKLQRETGRKQIDLGYYAQKMFTDKEYIESFQFITEGVANMFISSGSKVSQDSTALYKVLKTIKQIHNALTNSNSQRISGGSSEGQRLRASDSFIKNDKNRTQPSILRQQTPEFASLSSPKNFSKLGIPNPPIPSPTANNNNTSYTYNNTNTNTNMDKNRTSTTFASYNNNYNNNTNYTNNNNASLLNPNTTFRTTSNNMTSNIPINNNNSNNCDSYQCKNCFKVEVLEKKLEFLTAKLKKLIDDTQRIYQRLDQKLYQKTAVKKSQTVNNIHVQQRPAQGSMVFFGDDNWNLVLNMMIGIQMAVRSVRGYQQMIYEEPQDFNLKYYFELVPRRFGDQNYISRICSFTDYAPNTFNHIRKIFNIDNEQYINSIGPNKLMTSLMMGQVNSLSGLTSQGKSGSFFYYTADSKYMLKTIQYREYKHLRHILKGYYQYIHKNPDTLITKFFGLHKLIQKDGQGDVIRKIYFVIMANVFNTTQKIIQRYDIKGSSYGRQTRSTHPNATKKDNDFKSNRKPLQLDPQYRQQLMKIIRKDSQFFRRHQIIDYSLLIGIIKKNPTATAATTVQHHPTHQQRQYMRNSPDKLKSRQTLQYQLNYLKQSHMYENVQNNQQYIFGIIDILTEYNTRKAMEYYFKSLIYGNGVSAVPPDDYSQRFVNFIDDVIFKKVDTTVPLMRMPAANTIAKQERMVPKKKGVYQQNNENYKSNQRISKNGRDSVIQSYKYISRDS